MEIDFYTYFTKRKNSTKVPVAGGIVESFTVTGHLKEPCSMMSPVIDLQSLPIDNAPAVLTYAWIPAFYRYYFVKDWTWNNGLWTVSLEVDVLATYKDQIGDTTAYIERCASESNGYIMDRLYPATLEPDVMDIFLNAPWTNVLVSQGCYVVGVISGSSSTTTGSAVTYYAMTISQLTDLVDYLLSDQYINDAGFTPINTEGVSHNVAKSLLNPMQYIVSCLWVPFAATDIGESSPRNIQVGYYPINTTIAQGYWMPGTVYGMEVEHTLLSHPDAATRGKYLNYGPFTKASCFLPPFGEFPLDLQYFEVGGANEDKVNFNVRVDLTNGKADLRVRRKDSTGQYFVIYSTAAMLGVPIQLAQVANDFVQQQMSVLSAIGSAVGAVGQAYSGNFIGAAHSGLMVLQSVGNAIESEFPQVVSQGTNGSFIAFAQSAYITYLFHRPVDEDNTEQGRPLCALRKIENLSGFIKCGEATVDYNAFSSELDSIHSYLLSGFFWE